MTGPATPPWRWPTLRLRPALILLFLFVGVGLWQGSTALLAMRSEGSRELWIRPYLWELTGTLSAYLLLPIVHAAVLNAPRPSGDWSRFLAVHGAAILAYVVLHDALMLGARMGLYRALAWGQYGLGLPGFRLAMESLKEVWAYLVLATGFGVWGFWKEAQARALRESQLESQLKEAQLQALTGNLDPHFLFNALNTISSVMYEDLAKTDALLSDLGLLLRASLEGGAAWSLGEERRHTEHYAALLMARFGDRFQLVWDLEAGLEGIQVPRFAVQQLVENAVKHNGDLEHPLEVRISGRRGEDGLRLRVEDNGAGFGIDAGAGTGLTTLRKSLSLMFGPAWGLDMVNRPLGGAWVEVRVGGEVGR